MTAGNRTRGKRQDESQRESLKRREETRKFFEKLNELEQLIGEFDDVVSIEPAEEE